MRAAFFAFLGYFLTIPGIVLMGVLDASMVFFLPLGIDFIVILMTARKPEWFWLYALLATLGSVIGAAGTYWIGRKVGEKGLTRFVSPRRLKRVEARVSRGSVVVAGLALIPPLWNRHTIAPLKHWDEHFATPEERRLAAEANRRSGIGALAAPALE